nr:ATP-dependent DNA helicase RecG [Gulosibacter bifidus]
MTEASPAHAAGAVPAASATLVPPETPLAKLVTAAEAKKLAKAFDMHTASDLLAHLPRRHAQRGELTRMSQLEAGEEVTLVAEVVSTGSRRMHNRRGELFTATITDGHGQVQLTWFSGGKVLGQHLTPGRRGMFSGKVSYYGGTLQLTHPDFQLFDEQSQQTDAAERWAREPIAIYPGTSAVRSWQFATILARVIDRITPLADPVPAAVRDEIGGMHYDEAVRRFHLPRSPEDIERAREALKFTEAFVLQAALAHQRAVAAQRRAVPRPLPSTEVTEGSLRARLDASLPFSLTDDQQTAGDEIAADLAQSTPMQRLLQGEVGSGKTLVAVRAMLQVAEHGGQSALLAPTEVLASQHLASITDALGPELAEQLRPRLLTGSMTKSERQRVMLDIVTGETSIVVGTHALLSDGVEFADLGLLIVDEQHRFGVEQRETLRRRGAATPHLLVLTATPIPRTVAMTAFGDLEISTLRTMPAGRQGIETFAVNLERHPTHIHRVWQRIREEIDAGRQAFVVCPAIEANEDAEDDRDTANVAEIVDVLERLPVLAGVRIAMLHGKLPGAEKTEIMRAFERHEIDVLVATTVIEVGVNVPNASVMAVLDADRFGIAQLHQLRGRVGRGQWPGLCLLVTRMAPESMSFARIEAVAETLDGFALAERDLELRREGDVLGSVQSGGRSSLKVLRVARDGDVIAQARAHASALLARDPHLQQAPALRDALNALGGEQLEHLGMG